MRKKIIILILLIGFHLPIFSEKLPSQVFKESNSKENLSNFEKIGSYTENEKDNNFFKKDEIRLLSNDEPDPDDGDGYGTGEGGFVGSRPLPLNDLAGTFCLLIQVGIYFAGHLVKKNKNNNL